MVNVNDILTIKYFQLLKAAMPSTQIFREYVPNDLGGDAYVLISAINNNGSGTLQSDDTTTSVQVAIYTKSTTDNSGDTMQDIATAVYNTIKPSVINQLTLAGVQVLTTELSNDVSQSPLDTGSMMFINRFITFTHKIFHSIN
jgi:hypothetical protein